MTRDRALQTILTFYIFAILACLGVVWYFLHHRNWQNEWDEIVSPIGYVMIAVVMAGLVEGLWNFCCELNIRAR